MLAGARDRIRKWVAKILSTKVLDMSTFDLSQVTAILLVTVAEF
jgi:hypothetical protein